MNIRKGTKIYRFFSFFEIIEYVRMGKKINEIKYNEKTIFLVMEYRIWSHSDSFYNEKRTFSDE